MIELLVVADDLTGANDTAVQFVRRGLPARVTLDPAGALAPEGGDFPVLVVDTQSRHLEPGEAARRVAEAVRRGREAGVGRFFKKTDSTLRGNVGSELEALRAASGCALLAFVPALPALGRTTRGGVQYVEGRPLHRTEFAGDPLDPVRESSVPALIGRQTEVAVACLDRDALDAADARLPERGVLVLDAESEADLRAAVRWLDRRGLLGATAGTAALAGELAEGAPWSTPRRVPAPPPELRGPMLVVGGSLHPTARTQMERAEAAGFATVLLPPPALVAADGPESAAAERGVAAAAEQLARGRPVLLRVAQGPGDVEACLALGERLGVRGSALHLRVAESTGRIVRRLLDRSRIGSLTVLGGDTLAGVVRALGGSALLPRCELLPGVVVSEPQGRGDLFIISRAGGFGDESALLRLRDVINGGGVP